ncbi:MAG: ABC transporter substrate-binding protein [Candidatus Latescibacteria bacterium]|nr:ABC transporter substrate-binding protein [Candidatus Latescibacterota bacterium]
MKSKHLILWIIVALILAFGLYAFLDRFRVGPERASVLKDEEPRRVICMAPSITETVFTLGLGDRVVGVSDFCTFPEEATKKERCGGWLNPNLEKITALHPDLVIIQGKHQKVRNYCQRRHIALLGVDMQDTASIFREIRNIGRALGCPTCAETLVSRIERDLQDVKWGVEGRPRPRVFLLIGRTPGSLAGLYTPGQGSFLAEVLEIAGGENTFGNVTQSYPQVSKESLVQRAPEVILEMQPGKIFTPEQVATLKADWQAIPSLPAVRNDRIYVITDDFALIPGPRIGRLARRIASVLHPEVNVDEKR